MTSKQDWRRHYAQEGHTLDGGDTGRFVIIVVVIAVLVLALVAGLALGGLAWEREWCRDFGGEMVYPSRFDPARAHCEFGAAVDTAPADDGPVIYNVPTIAATVQP